jgi:hypothetical protein
MTVKAWMDGEPICVARLPWWMQQACWRGEAVSQRSISMRTLSIQVRPELDRNFKTLTFEERGERHG